MILKSIIEHELLRDIDPTTNIINKLAKEKSKKCNIKQ